MYLELEYMMLTTTQCDLFVYTAMFYAFDSFEFSIYCEIFILNFDCNAGVSTSVCNSNNNDKK